MPPGAPGLGTRRRSRPFRVFTPALGLLLGGYLFLDKTFAYLHVPGTPFFVGEIVLGIGIAESIHLRLPWRRLVGSSPILKALLAFMVACMLRLVVDLPRYKLDAIRDSSIWYYGAFAFLVAAAVVADPTFLPQLLRWYRRALPWFLVWAPFAIVLHYVDSLSAVTVPGSDAPINSWKPQDLAIQVAAGVTYLWLGVHRVTGEQRRSPPRSETALTLLGILGVLLAGTQTRGGFLAAVLLLGIVVLYLTPGRQRRMVVPVGVGLVLMLVFALVLNLKLHGEVRDISVGQALANVSSITGQSSSDQLSGTVQWREGMWGQVITDLRTHGTWLTGIGFGVILPDRYNVDVGNTNNENSTAPLRSVHNSHLTLLARTGVPAFALWLLLWVVFCRQLYRAAKRRPGGIRDPANALTVWLLAAPPAYLVNAVFDPALEGPHSGVWLFTIVGVAAAHVALLRTNRRGAA
ncbi:MAG TPA: O-antigen ligase family protein [Actinomycetes bacterium]